MDKATEAALEASIKHWEENLNAKTPDDAEIGPNACALCTKFRCKVPVLHCKNCPVAEATGRHLCQGTPYDEAENAYYAWKNGDEGAELRWRIAARVELDFLKALRPK